jgi:hypothetical protein
MRSFLWTGSVRDGGLLFRCGPERPVGLRGAPGDAGGSVEAGVLIETGILLSKWVPAERRRFEI